MAEYINRNLALEAQNKSMNLAECRKRLERIPAADVRPVVTCGECIHYKKRFWDNGKCYGSFCDIWNRDHGKTFFCSAGKREVEHD